MKASAIASLPLHVVSSLSGDPFSALCDIQVIPMGSTSGSTRDLLKKGQWEDSVRIFLTEQSHLKSSLSGWNLPNFYPRLAFWKNRIVLVTPGKMFSKSIKMSNLTSICLFCLLLSIIILIHKLAFLSELSWEPFGAVTSDACDSDTHHAWYRHGTLCNHR